MAWKLAMLSVLAAMSARAADALVVHVDGLRNQNGQVGCMVYASADGFPKSREKAARKMLVKIAERSATCVFEDLKPGTYAVIVMHDENGNGELDRNFLGIPTEGWGASGAKHGGFGPPKFDDSAFRYEGGAAEIRITIHY